MRVALSLRLAWEHVRAGFGRMALSALAVALGVALVVAIRLMNAAVLASFLDSVDAVTGRAALTIGVGEGLTFDQRIAEVAAAVPGVKLAVPLVRTVAFPDDGSGELLIVHGVDLTHDAAVRVYHPAGDPTEVIDDLLVFLNQPDSVVLGRPFAASRGLGIDSTLDLVTPRGVRRFTVRGLLEPQGVARTVGGRLVVMDLYAAQRAFTADEQVNQVDLVLERDADVDATKAAVAAVLPPGLRVEEPMLRKEVIRQTVGGLQAMLTAFGLLAVLAGFVICYSRLGAIFEARTWEVGLLRAVGLRQTTVFVELLKESLLLGVGGTAIGLPLGVTIAHYGLPIFAAGTAINFNLPITSPVAVPSIGAFVLGTVVGLGAAVLAAIVPALRLAHKQPVAALTMRGRETPRATPRAEPVVLMVLVAIVGGLVAWEQTTQLTALGNVTTALVALAAVVAAGPLVRRGGRLLGVAWLWLFGPTGEFAAAHLTQHARRATLTVATLGVGLGAVMMFGLLGWSVERSVISQLSARFRADLVVTSPFTSSGWMDAPLSEGIIEKVEDIPGVAIASGQHLKNVTYDGTSTALFSYDPVCFLNERVCRWPLESGAAGDALERVARGEAVIVSHSTARQHGLEVGSVVRLDSPRGPQTLPVAGIAREEPSAAIILSRHRYRTDWNDPTVTWVYALLDEGASAPRVEALIATTLGQSYRVQVRSVPEFMDYFAHQIQHAFNVLFVMELVILVLVLIGIGDTLATGVLERTREFAMMRAVGLRRSRLFGVVMLEGAAIAILGLVLAAGAGLALGAFWVNVQFPAILGWKLDAYFPSVFAAKRILLTLLLCLTGSLLPALRASRLAVSGALRNE